jgi:adenylyltransferase/sulfurtransferase
MLQNMEEREIQLSSADFEEDRYARLRLIPWWDQERLKNATVMVVGAGAIGNELIKNLTLLGIGRILVYDMDAIESTNLTRSVLYRAHDVGRYKAEVAAERAKEMNPDVKAKAFIANIIDDVGLGVFRRMNVVLGGLDNREARLSINQSCYKVDRPWIDGAIEALNGFARVFIPGQGACYECTMTETDWMLINKRKSCALPRDPKEDFANCRRSGLRLFPQWCGQLHESAAAARRPNTSAKPKSCRSARRALPGTQL